MTREERYSGVAILLHWTIALLIVGQLAGGFIAEDIPRGDPAKFALMQAHKSFGITVLVLTIARLAWRVGHKPPALPLHMPGWEKLLARGVHALFYVAMLGVPLIGWALASTTNVPTMLFGVIPLPHLGFIHEAANRRELHETFEELHEAGAFLMIGLIGLHVIAALKHQFVDRDTVLASMAPIFSKRVT